MSFFIGIHSFTLSLRNLAHSLVSSPSLLTPSFLPFLLPLYPSRPLFRPTVNALGSRTLNLSFLSEGGLFIKALSFPNTDLSITKLHLHTYCCLTPCAKYSFVKPSPIPCLHLVEIVFFQLQALLSIQAGLGWHKQHTAVPLGKLIVKGSGWGFESALCYFCDSCRFFCCLIRCDQLRRCVPQQGGTPREQIKARLQKVFLKCVYIPYSFVAVQTWAVMNRPAPLEIKVLTRTIKGFFGFSP